MGDIFLSYRRQDCAAATGRLADRLRERFGAGHVFLDVCGIVPGEDFVQALDRAVGSATVVLAMVGPGWLQAVSADGSRRLDDPDDFVRREIEATLAHGKPLIPVLVDGARMPGAQSLPASIQPLAHCQAAELRHDRWDADTAALIDVLASQYGVHPVWPRMQPAAPWWHWPASLVLDLAELLVHPRALILRHCGNAVDTGSGRALLQALAMLLLCLALGNLLLGMVLGQPLHQWVLQGVTIGLLSAAVLSGTLAVSWRLVRRAPGWRRVTTLFAYLYGGAWLYLCVGALMMVLGVQYVQPDIFDRFLVQARQGSDALPAAFAMVVQAARGPALAAGVFANAVLLAGAVWCVRAWAVFRIALGTGRLAAAAAWLLWVGMLAGLCTLAWWMAT